MATFCLHVGKRPDPGRARPPPPPSARAHFSQEQKGNRPVKYLALPLSLGAAMAAGIAVPAAAQTFEGPYVGAQAGWSQNKLGTVDTDLGTGRIDDKRDSATA